MSTPTIQYAPSSRMGLYEPLHQLGMWEDAYHGNTVPGTGVCPAQEAENKLDDKVKHHKLFRLIWNRILVSGT